MKRWLLAWLLALALPASAATAPVEMYEYEAHLGDTLTSISQHFLEGAGWQQLLKYNRIANPDKINPGQIIRIPIDLMKRDAAPAQIVSARGEAEIVGKGGVLGAGSAVAQGDQLRTGKDGYVVIRLADGSILKLPADSQVQLKTAEKVRDTDAVRSVLRLIGGRIESLVSKFRGSGNRFEVTTEQAVTGVRGTDFRVTVDGDSTASEVLEGKVAFDGAGAAAGKSAQLPAGFGSKASGDGQLLAPVQLLPAPDMASAAALQERLVVRFEFPPLAQALKYRAQVSRDQDFYQVVAETVVDAPRLRFGGLDDGPYFLRVRGIDVNGLEGRDALLPFTLKARPEPPLVSAPADKGKVRVAPVEFAWANVGTDAKYRMQIARDAAFTDVVFTSPDTPETKLNAPATLPLGDYFWRIRTIEGQDTGPWSDVRSFHLLPPPAVPEPPQIDARRIRFSWTGEPGQTFVFQVARDAWFVNLLFEEKLITPALDKPKPKSGTYYMRYRAIDADGFEGPYTAAQRFVVDPPRVSGASNAYTTDE